MQVSETPAVCGNCRRLSVHLVSLMGYLYFHLTILDPSVIFRIEITLVKYIERIFILCKILIFYYLKQFSKYLNLAFILYILFILKKNNIFTKYFFFFYFFSIFTANSVLHSVEL